MLSQLPSLVLDESWDEILSETQKRGLRPGADNADRASLVKLGLAEWRVKLGGKILYLTEAGHRIQRKLYPDLDFEL